MIVEQKDAECFDTGYGEAVYPLAALTQHSVAIAEIEPGKASRKHYHPTIEESYFILEGEAKIFLNDEEFVLKVGQLVAIPIGVTHKIINTSKTKTLRFLAICAKPWTPHCSVFLE